MRNLKLTNIRAKVEILNTSLQMMMKVADLLLQAKKKVFKIAKKKSLLIHFLNLIKQMKKELMNNFKYCNINNKIIVHLKVMYQVVAIIQEMQVLKEF